MPEALAHSPHAPSVNRVLGPILVGTVFNTMIYGICLVQLWTYYTSRMERQGKINLLVNWVFLLDTFHTISLCYLLWKYTVQNFDNLSYLTHADWPFAATPIITALTSLPIQVYLSWRIRLFSGSMRVFVFLAILALIQTALGFACSAMAFLTASISDFRRLIPFVDAWQVMAVSCDVSVTLLLWWFLNKSRTGSEKSDNVITRVIRSSIETAAFGAFFCIMDLVTFTAFPSNNFHVIFAFPMGRIYTWVSLLTLNTRQSLREDLEQQQIPEILVQPTVCSRCTS
ncbi:hypothetical protein P691DRAFT_794469 [Macrolepiota fuliginosa MF-IS2]|uniref:DUF6534 domain-containing protein n=1 Tax=Macrolepiota fuliginosa MF-IS2 TaxID=1400762 RepID=A0A9P6BZM4_9AGAR|nr:hypothetical protein P691DRAFT_794469 [Macrolepiota fuliginosa MF-IS2]